MFNPCHTASKLREQGTYECSKTYFDPKIFQHHRDTAVPELSPIAPLISKLDVAVILYVAITGGQTRCGGSTYSPALELDIPCVCGCPRFVRKAINPPHDSMLIYLYTCVDQA